MKIERMNGQVSNTQNQKTEPEEENLRVYAAEEVGRKVRLYWVSDETGDKGYTEVERTTLEKVAPGFFQGTQFLESIGAKNGELKMIERNDGLFPDKDERARIEEGD